MVSDILIAIITLIFIILFIRLFYVQVVKKEYYVKDFSTFSGIIIMNYEFMTLEYGGYVNIYGDDRLLYSSAEVKKGYIPMSFNIDISNVNILRIEFTGYFKTISIAEPCLIR